MSEKSRFDPSTMGSIGQLFGGIGAGLGQTIAHKLNDRLTVAAAAMQGILACSSDATFDFKQLATDAVEVADALLARLDEVPDPRHEKAREAAASIGIAEP